MTKFNQIFILLLCFTLFNCASTQNQSVNDGSSFEKAIKVSSVEQEYKIVQEKCLNCQFKSQGLSFNEKDKPFDILTFTKPSGEEIKFYFDISKFYGRF